MADFLLGGAIDPTNGERTGESTTVESGDLTTHGVIVGMTGSGKTGLGVILVEEALRSGIPVLAIDPKGDLTNLCLTFPGLSGAEFTPWVNAGDAQQAGQSVDEFAAAQASMWSEGLAGWGLGGDQIRSLRDSVEFRIHTPGSTAGIGLNIVGSLAAPTGAAADDAEILADEIDGFVTGLLGLVDVSADPLTSREHILLSNLVHHEWTAGRSLDLAGLVGLVLQPPLRKLGVFDLDAFFPPADRQAFAMRLNGLLASPAFAAWLTGDPIDMDTLLRTPDGRPRCAIITTSHLSDQERQFVTTLVLSELVTWMRRQSGTTDLRALLYMDEVAGYLPPTAMPATKKPIMTLMKQARAFGVGVVLSTQNPVDIDYKALSNAGTWMIGRLQTEQDKQRLLDGMSAAAGGVDIRAIGDTIAGLGKRQFVLRRAGKDTPELFATRWAMSYLRGPLTRDQIATLMDPLRSSAAPSSAPATGAEASAATAATSPEPAPATATATAAPAAAAAPALGADETTLVPEVASGFTLRWVDPAAPWLADIGADPTGTRYEAAVVARVALRYDETRADLVHDEEYEAVLFPLTDPPDATRAIAVDHDDRDLRADAPAGAVYRLPAAPVKTAAFAKRVERDLVDHLVRSRTIDLQTNKALKLWGRPGESAEEFGRRCLAAADAKADDEIATLRDKYEAKAAKLRDRIQAAEAKVDLARTQAKGRRSEEVLSTAGSILGGLLGGKKSRGAILGSVLGKAGSAAGRRSRSASADRRVDAAEDQLEGLLADVEDLEVELAEEITEIDARWMATAKETTTMSVPLERSDVRITQLVLAWIPVP
jgi:hypothetical protein